MSSLSVARHIALDRNLLLYLENLALRAYLVVYGPRSGVLVCLKNFLRRGFPRAVRSMLPHLAVALAALLCGALAGYLLVQADPDRFSLLVPGDLAGGRGPGSTREELIHEELFAPWPGFVHAFVVFADSLFRHNAMVGLLCFGLGFALGVPTLILLLYNGLTIGAFLALHVERGLGIEFMGWLSIHGVTEIPYCSAAPPDWSWRRRSSFPAVFPGWKIWPGTGAPRHRPRPGRYCCFLPRAYWKAASGR